MNHVASISYHAKVLAVKDWLIVTVPKEESSKLGSRGQISVRIELNDQAFDAILEPDGRFSHWFRISDTVQRNTKVNVGDAVTVTIAKNETWPEPTVPEDLKYALQIAPQNVQDKWIDITSMARWEWVRWTNATLSQETRAVRVAKTISKLNGKHRRPCCFNLAACTEPYVTKSGKLIEPSI